MRKSKPKIVDVKMTYAEGTFEKPHIEPNKPTKTNNSKKRGDMNIVDDLQRQLDILFGVIKPDGKPRFSNFIDLYKFFTGDIGMVGGFFPDKLPISVRAGMGLDSSSFPNALANTLNRFLSAGFNKVNYFENILISQQAPSTRIDAAAFTELGCWADLPDIDPEAEDYQDLPDITEADNPFNLIQKGCVIPVTRKAIVNDDVKLFKGLSARLGLVSRKSHARYVWNKFINNDNCNDGTAWFSATHGNLGSAALSIIAVTAAITALVTMDEPGPSTDVLGIDLSKPQFYLVVAPSAWDEAIKVNQTKYTYTTNDLTDLTPNPCYRMFGVNNERIVTPPFITGTDWGVIRDKEEVPIIEMQYLHGKTEPYIFFQSDPRSDRAIESDIFWLKGRFEFGGAVSNYRGGYKSVP